MTKPKCPRDPQGHVVLAARRPGESRRTWFCLTCDIKYPLGDAGPSDHNVWEKQVITRDEGEGNVTPFTFDRIMSLHRQAYRCETIQEWWDLAQRLDCPVDARDQFFKTAQLAKESGMSEKQAFPLTGDIPAGTGRPPVKPLDRSCQPGDWVWWKQLDQTRFEGVLKEWDSNVAIVTTSPDGKEKAVEC